jgi:hypothetical protein
MKFLLLTIAMLSSLSHAGIPVKDFAGMINDTVVIAESAIPLEDKAVGRLKSKADCDYVVSVHEELDQSVFGKLFGLSSFFLNIHNISCNFENDRYSMELEDRKILLSKPIASGDEIIIPVGALDIAKLVTESKKNEFEGDIQ